MNITINLFARYDTVYLVNGVFVENGKVYAREGEVTYVTVLPLSAVLLPYTVRLLGDKVSCNENLCYSVKKSEREICVYFQPRYNYVYTPSEKFCPPSSAVSDFFHAVKQRSCKKARSFLTASLSSSVTDDNLIAFFDGYDDIIEGDDGVCFLTGKGGKACSFKFTLLGDKIDDVNEV